jgi:hypothetical protein
LGLKPGEKRGLSSERSLLRPVLRMHGVGGSPGAEGTLTGGHRHRPVIAGPSKDSFIADLLARVGAAGRPVVDATRTSAGS